MGGADSAFRVELGGPVFGEEILRSHFPIGVQDDFIHKGTIGNTTNSSKSEFCISSLPWRKDEHKMTIPGPELICQSSDSTTGVPVVRFGTLTDTPISKPSVLMTQTSDSDVQ